jgi:hypothetical protein
MGEIDFQRQETLHGFGKASAVKNFALVVVLGLWAFSAWSAQTASQFNVTVKQQVSSSETAGPSSAFCRIGPGPRTFGAIVTIVCSTGVVVDIEAPRTAVPWAPIHGGAYRFTHLSEYELLGMQSPGGIDSYTGVGTVTTWRKVNLPDRDYLEMLIGW